MQEQQEYNEGGSLIMQETSS